MDTQGQRLGLSLFLVGLMLQSGGCAGTSDGPIRSAADEGRRATQIMREREQELAALRADIASTRIAAAKQEAEVHELRATVAQLRQENGASHQALLEARRMIQTRDDEVVAIKVERDRFVQVAAPPTLSERQLTLLQDTVASLSQELAEIKSAMVLAAHKPGEPSVNQSASFAGLTQNATDGIIPAVHIMREGADRSKPSWVTVQPGESWWSLARKYRTTVNALRAVNGRVGDHVIVGEEIRLP
jgi:LysM repeat protein